MPWRLELSTYYVDIQFNPCHLNFITVRFKLKKAEKGEVARFLLILPELCHTS